MEEETKIISFPVDYKGKAADKLLVRLKAFLFFAFVGLGLFGAGLILFLICREAKASPGREMGYSFVLMGAGFFLVVISPAASLVQGINPGYEGMMAFKVAKKGKGLYAFRLEARKKGEPVVIEGVFNDIKVCRGYAAMKDGKGNEFVFPFRAMDDEGKRYVTSMGMEFKAREKEQRKNKGK